jgi:hypothetical protein
MSAPTFGPEIKKRVDAFLDDMKKLQLGCTVILHAHPVKAGLFDCDRYTNLSEGQSDMIVTALARSLRPATWNPRIPQ